MMRNEISIVGCGYQKSGLENKIKINLKQIYSETEIRLG
jgi:hypothetical protein